MRRVIYSVAMSLDGFIAGPSVEYDWIIHDPAIDFGAMFARFDTVLMGRRTFELALEAAPELHLEKLTGPLFGLGEYRDAIAYAMSAGRLGAVKVAFDLRGLRA